MAPPSRRDGFFIAAAPLRGSASIEDEMKVTISRDNPCLYLTMVCKDRLPVFRKDECKELTCQSLEEARKSGEFLIFAYVIMLDHLHLITDRPRQPSEILRFIKGITAHRILAYLKEQGYHSSLEKLRHQEQERGYRYSLWQHESNVLELTSESFLMQKVNYIHLNPVAPSWWRTQWIIIGQAPESGQGRR